MVEVFKTNVKDPAAARALLERIHTAHRQYAANLDLEDCDKILRVECRNGTIDTSALLRFLHDLGFEAEVLPDDEPVDEGPHRS